MHKRKLIRTPKTGVLRDTTATIRLPDTTKQKLQRIADRGGNSLSNQCLLFLTAALEKEESQGGAA